MQISVNQGLKAGVVGERDVARMFLPGPGTRIESWRDRKQMGMDQQRDVTLACADPVVMPKDIAALYGVSTVSDVVRSVVASDLEIDTEYEGVVVVRSEIDELMARTCYPSAVVGSIGSMQGKHFPVVLLRNFSPQNWTDAEIRALLRLHSRLLVVVGSNRSEWFQDRLAEVGLRVEFMPAVKLREFMPNRFGKPLVGIGARSAAYVGQAWAGRNTMFRAPKEFEKKREVIADRLTGDASVRQVKQVIRAPSVTGLETEARVAAVRIQEVNKEIVEAAGALVTLHPGGLADYSRPIEGSAESVVVTSSVDAVVQLDAHQVIDTGGVKVGSPCHSVAVVVLSGATFSVHDTNSLGGVVELKVMPLSVDVVDQWGEAGIDLSLAKVDTAERHSSVRVISVAERFRQEYHDSALCGEWYYSPPGDEYGVGCKFAKGTFDRDRGVTFGDFIRLSKHGSCVIWDRHTCGHMHSQTHSYVRWSADGFSCWRHHAYEIFQLEGWHVMRSREGFRVGNDDVDIGEEEGLFDGSGVYAID